MVVCGSTVWWYRGPLYGGILEFTYRKMRAASLDGSFGPPKPLHLGSIRTDFD